MRKFLLPVFIGISWLPLRGQDSVVASIRPRYDSVGKLHRRFFGENYRKEWALRLSLPVIRISQIKGGLTPVRLGGGHQTLSLRLTDATGKEWVLRSIEKNPSVLLPLELRETFAKDVLDDAMSAQHPFAPLVIPPLADAAGVLHTNPIIGLVAADPSLGQFEKLFAGKICLFEEREPTGKSDNSAEMLEALKEDNDNTFDGRAFLRARMLDMLIGDWDRHADQWRWTDVQKGKGKRYVAIPRDRDQALYVNEGIIPHAASRPWLAPNLQGFGPRIKHVKYSLLESNFLNAYPPSHFNYADWTQLAKEFVQAMPDTLLERALKLLPPASYKMRFARLIYALKKRRDAIPAAMDDYYRFVNRFPDLLLSDKNEFVRITGQDTPGLTVTVFKRTRKNVAGDTLMSTYYDPAITRELRIYTGRGDDSILIDNQSSRIRLRLITGEGAKHINAANVNGKTKIYAVPGTVTFSGHRGRISKHFSADTSNTHFVPTNRYNVAMPLINAGFNLDDGFLLGLGVQFTHQGFRKRPNAGVNRLLLAHSFSTSAYRIRYSSEWIDVFGKADLLINANVLAPNNTQNFFGRGNETPFYKIDNFKKFYRARFSLIEATAAIRWKLGKVFTLSAGPSIQHYEFDSSDNTGRFVVQPFSVNSYDSLTLSKSKTHVGLVVQFIADKRNNRIIPVKGFYVSLRVAGYEGLGDFSKSFAQIFPEAAAYLHLNKKATAVFANRLGAAFTAGKSTFYQSGFIGGHDNLLGYRQYRFAGETILYNNTELRVKLAKFTGYIIPGQFGMIGFFDIGRVWVKSESSDKWHNGAGGGFYFAPAQLAVISAVAGYSKEGWYPYISLGFRF